MLAWPEFVDGTCVEAYSRVLGGWNRCDVCCVGRAPGGVQSSLQRLTRGRVGWRYRWYHDMDIAPPTETDPTTDDPHPLAQRSPDPPLSQPFGGNPFALLALLRVWPVDGKRRPPIPAAPGPAGAWITPSLLTPSMALLAVSSPYGALSEPVFANSHTHGVVANTLEPVGGRRSHATPSSPLILTDIRSLPGSEGGPVFVAGDKGFVGVLAGPVSHPGLLHATEIALVVTTRPIALFVEAAAKLCFSRTRGPKMTLSRTVPAIRVWSRGAYGKKATSSVLIASVGGNWASCFPVTADGYILTNRHLLDRYLTRVPRSEGTGRGNAEELKVSPGTRVTVGVERANLYPPCDDETVKDETVKNETVKDETAARRSNRVWLPARVVMVEPGVWDVAVLKVDLGAWTLRMSGQDARRNVKTSANRSVFGRIRPRQPLHFSPFHISEAHDLVEGSPVYAIGHALAPPPSNLFPSVTKGVLSRVVRGRDGEIVAATSTAAIHQGNSGGALVDARGRLVGMVTCNVKHTASRGSPANTGEILSAKSPAVFARLNMAIPARVLAPLAAACARCETARDDRALAKAEACLRSALPKPGPGAWEIWNLNNSPGGRDATKGPTGSGGDKFRRLVKRVRAKEAREKARRAAL